jgi:serine/threonine protein kinase
VNLKAEEQQKNQEGPMVCPADLEVFPSGHTFCPTHEIELTTHGTDDLVGKVINERYQVNSSLTAGGWASVYRGSDIMDGRDVAIKVMHSYLLSDAEAVARFQREAKAAAALTHPCLAAVYDAGVLSHGQPYIVMEFVNGITLTDRIATLGPLTAEQAIPMFIQVCDAISIAHENGIIHRDIKPSNLILSQAKNGEPMVKVVDFGLARAMSNCGLDIDQITRSGQTLGSPAYMSPEQCLGYKLDARSDIYALGCTMYEGVTGAPPFIAQSVLEYMHKHTYEDPPSIQIRSTEANVGYNMAHVIMQALAKTADDRQQSMTQLRDQLQACMWQSGVHQVTEAPKGNQTLTRITQSMKRIQVPKFKRVFGWLSFLAPVVLLCLMIWGFIHFVRHQSPAPEAAVKNSPSNAKQERPVTARSKRAHRP